MSQFVREIFDLNKPLDVLTEEIKETERILDNMFDESEKLFQHFHENFYSKVKGDYDEAAYKECEDLIQNFHTDKIFYEKQLERLRKHRTLIVRANDVMNALDLKEKEIEETAKQRLDSLKINGFSGKI